jgi:hypothetical protein
MKARVLDILFPLEVTPIPYFTKMVLRFGDSDTQLVAVIYPGAKCELLQYSLSGPQNASLSQVIAKMVAENPNVKGEDISNKFKVDVKRSVIDYAALEGELEKLRTIRISPRLATRASLDNAYDYEYWFDTWQESVHYNIRGPFNRTNQDELVKWMVGFRMNLPSLVKAPSTKR